MKKTIFKAIGSRFCEGEIELDDKGELHITGTEGCIGYQRGNPDRITREGRVWTIESGGQIQEAIAAFFPGLVPMLPWHLNHMRPGCEHQDTWDTSKRIEVTDYTWGDAFHALRRKVEEGKATPEEYAQHVENTRRVYAVTLGHDCPKWETEEVKSLLAAGLIKVGKKETKAAGWVLESEHPAGLLCKPCPVCGYRYGSAWTKRDLPQEIVDLFYTLESNVEE